MAKRTTPSSTSPKRKPAPKRPPKRPAKPAKKPAEKPVSKAARSRTAPTSKSKAKPKPKPTSKPTSKRAAKPAARSTEPVKLTKASGPPAHHLVAIGAAVIAILGPLATVRSVSYVVPRPSRWVPHLQRPLLRSEHEPRRRGPLTRHPLR